MKKLLVMLVVAITALALLGGGAAAAWWHFRPKPSPSAEPAAPPVDKTDYKYISLDKVIVMLRNGAGEPVSHYLAVDLVFKTPVDGERVTKEHLPLLRSVAVKALSSYTLEAASQLSIEQFTVAINDAFTKSYAADQRDKPFTTAMIGKLIIE